MNATVAKTEREQQVWEKLNWCFSALLLERGLLGHEKGVTYHSKPYQNRIEVVIDGNHWYGSLTEAIDIVAGLEVNAKPELVSALGPSRSREWFDQF